MRRSLLLAALLLGAAAVAVTAQEVGGGSERQQGCAAAWLAAQHAGRSRGGSMFVSQPDAGALPPPHLCRSC